MRYCSAIRVALLAASVLSLAAPAAGLPLSPGERYVVEIESPVTAPPPRSTVNNLGVELRWTIAVASLDLTFSLYDAGGLVAQIMTTTSSSVQMVAFKAPGAPSIQNSPSADIDFTPFLGMTFDGRIEITASAPIDVVPFVRNGSSSDSQVRLWEATVGGGGGSVALWTPLLISQGVVPEPDGALVLAAAVAALSRLRRAPRERGSSALRQTADSARK